MVLGAANSCPLAGPEMGNTKTIMTKNIASLLANKFMDQIKRQKPLFGCHKHVKSRDWINSAGFGIFPEVSL